MTFHRRVIFLTLLMAVLMPPMGVLGQQSTQPQPPLLYITIDTSGQSQGQSMQVWRMNPQSKRLLRLATLDTLGVEDLQWSPDGRSIMFLADRAWGNELNDIWVMDADGDHARLLVENMAYVNWHPDSQHIAYVSVTDETSSIHSITIDGTEDHVLVENAQWPSWSPDGTTLAYSSGLSLMLLKDGEATTLFDGTDDFVDTIKWTQWSPDGQMLAFLTSGQTEDGQRADFHLMYTIHADGTHLTQIANNIQRPMGGEHIYLYEWKPFDWSPDSATIGFISVATWIDEDVTGLYTVKPDGTDLQRLIIGNKPFTLSAPGKFSNFHSLDWSPDGTLILFSGKQDRTFGFDLYTIRPDGSDLRSVITTDGIDVFPVWQPLEHSD